MVNKIVPGLREALAGIHDGATIMIGGFGNAGMPRELIDGLIDQGATNLTIVNNNAGNGDTGLAALLAARRVKKIICSFPRQADSHVFDGLYRSGELALELTPQGNLAERIRAAGAGVGAFFSPTGYGTLLAEGKETRLINGKNYVLEYPIHADFALIKALKADRWGNLVYRKAARNFGPIMAMAATCTIVQVDQVVELGELDPEVIVTPGIFVQRVVQVNGVHARSDLLEMKSLAAWRAIFQKDRMSISVLVYRLWWPIILIPRAKFFFIAKMVFWVWDRPPLKVKKMKI